MPGRQRYMGIKSKKNNYLSQNFFYTIIYFKVRTHFYPKTKNYLFKLKTIIL